VRFRLPSPRALPVGAHARPGGFRMRWDTATVPGVTEPTLFLTCGSAVIRHS